MNETIFQYLLDLLNCIIGVFAGFFLALYLQKLAEKKAKKEKIKLVLMNISDELSDISTTLQQYIEQEQCLACRIQTPSWDALLGCGFILELIQHPMYPHIVKAYALIKLFNDEYKERLDSDNVKNIEEIVFHVRKLSKLV